LGQPFRRNQQGWLCSWKSGRAETLHPTCKSDAIDHSRLLGQSQVTDVYLLALAVKNGGRVVTLDRRVTLGAVRGARSEHLVVV
jgi:predicted nucleic acid-binding protein